jgi:hypothetical protein
VTLDAVLSFIGKYEGVLLHVNSYKITLDALLLPAIFCEYRHTAIFCRRTVFTDLNGSFQPTQVGNSRRNAEKQGCPQLLGSRGTKSTIPVKYQTVEGSTREN